MAACERCGKKVNSLLAVFMTPEVLCRNCFKEERTVRVLEAKEKTEGIPDQLQSISTPEFSMIKFLGVTMWGALVAFVTLVILLLIGFFFSDDASPLVGEGAFNLITLGIAVLVFGGMFSGGRYSRQLWEAGAKTGATLAAISGTLIGLFYFPLQVFVINRVLCQALHIPYNNETTLPTSLILGICGALAFILLGFFHQGEEGNT